MEKKVGYCEGKSEKGHKVRKKYKELDNLIVVVWWMLSLIRCILGIKDETLSLTKCKKK